MKKKTVVKLSLVLCLLLCMSLVACDNDVKDEPHKAKSEWSFNETEHWHDCATEGCTEKFEKAAHAFGDWETKTPSGSDKTGEQKRVCTVCGKEETKTLPASKPTSEKGNTYKQSNFVVEWESEEAKNDVLKEQTEEQFMQIYNNLKTTMIFNDDDSVLVTAPGFPPTGYSKSLYYSIAEDRSITFYETLEDKANDTPFKDEGFFEYTFVISKDYTTISMIGTLPGAKCEIVLTIV